tara:strand:- start:377 stop:556 length:180 start_codon:yes stop_codon:yes gene_type:complete
MKKNTIKNIKMMVIIKMKKVKNKRKVIKKEIITDFTKYEYDPLGIRKFGQLNISFGLRS